MNSEDEDLDLISYLNSNNKLVKSVTELNMDQPPRKKFRTEENCTIKNDTFKKTENSNSQTQKYHLFNVENICSRDNYLELTLQHVNEDQGSEKLSFCHLYGSW